MSKEIVTGWRAVLAAILFTLRSVPGLVGIAAVLAAWIASLLL